MSTEQPPALMLADELMDGMNDEHWNQLTADAAAELRRLHAENEDLKARIARADVERQRAVLAEREACASVCDRGAEQLLHAYKREGAGRCAAAIRARSKPQGEQT